MMYKLFLPKNKLAASRAKILLVPDRPNWAYDSIARAIIKYNYDSDLEFDIEYVKGGGRSLKKIHKNFDLVFMMGWQLLGKYDDGKIIRLNKFLDPKRTVTGIHSHHSWDNRETMPDKNIFPPEVLTDFLNNYSGVNVVSRRLYDLFLSAGLRNSACTLNGVDASVFVPKVKMKHTNMRVGFSGNDKHDWRKGISEFVEPACDLNNVELKLAMPKKGHHIPLDEMHHFYSDLDAYVCASSSEGFSLSVLEASSCGCPIISTRVGGCEDLIIDGVNGFLVDRNVDAIKEKVVYLRDNINIAHEMGVANRNIVQQLWSWEVRVKAWIAFIKNSLNQ